VKKKFNVYGVIAMVLVVLFVMTGCKKDEEEDDDPLGSISAPKLTDVSLAFPAGVRVVETYAEAASLWSSFVGILPSVKGHLESINEELLVDATGYDTQQKIIDAVGTKSKFEIGKLTINDNTKFLADLKYYNNAFVNNAQGTASVKGTHYESIESNIGIITYFSRLFTYFASPAANTLAVGNRLNESGTIDRTFSIGGSFLNTSPKVIGIWQFKQSYNSGSRVERIEGTGSNTRVVFADESANNNRVSGVVLVHDGSIGAKFRFYFSFDGKWKQPRSSQWTGGNRTYDVEVINPSDNRVIYTLRNAEHLDDALENVNLGFNIDFYPH